jgi:hypothetical protein
VAPVEVKDVEMKAGEAEGGEEVRAKEEVVEDRVEMAVGAKGAKAKGKGGKEEEGI